MTTTTPHGQVPAIQRYKIGYHSDEWGVRSSTPSGIYDDAGPWVRYEDHVTALKAAQPVVTPQPGAAYAALPDVDALAQEIRRVDGAHKLGAGALAEALMPFLRASRGQASSQAGEYPALVCDYCGALTPDPWHSSGMLHGKMSKHIHSCDACCRGAAQPSPAAQEDALSDDAVRVPLDSLHADAAYLIGRLREGSMPYARVIEIIRERIDAAKAAIRARAAQGDALDAARYRWLRDCEWRDTDLEPFIRLQLNMLWDAKIDAARAAQEGK